MASDNEPAKLLLPYLQRADELQKHEPLVAYYCRLYAMERGLKIPQSERTKTTNALLISLMKQLEKDKKSLQLGPDDHFHLEGFASNVFAKADKQDRAGRADLNTAKTFYAASIFFEILNQFGELLPDLEQKQKYAAWKAADIRKAIKEGRKPVPGPPGGDKELSMLSSTSSGEYELDPSRTDEAAKPDLRTEPDSSPQFHDQFHHPHHTPDVPLSPSNNSSPPPPNYPTSSYPTHDFPPPPSNNLPDKNSSYSQPPSNIIPDNSSYSQPPSNNVPDNSSYSPPPYHHQSYPQEPPPPPQHFPQNYQSHESPQHFPQNYPNFQSYPSFADTSLPTAPPNNYPSFHQGTDASYSTSAPPPQNYSSAAAQYSNSSSSRNGNVPEAAAPPTKVYHYDSSYQPPPEKVAEAHKAARFAVGALAFDDVSIAVDYLKKSLELLTNPSSSS